MRLMETYSSPPTVRLQQGRCFVGRAVTSTVEGMTTGDRRSKVTPETKDESRRLAQLWATRSHPTQAVFGETYGIGNQSAVGQFLRGEVPLSLKAARGFAVGLGCRIEEFSPRLAREAAGFASVMSGHPEVAEVAAAIGALPKKQRDWVLEHVRQAVEIAQETLTPPSSSQDTVTHHNIRPVRKRA